MEDRNEEIRRLQGCISDLISVLALPALWSSRASSQIVSTLLDGLVGMLRLEFAYARLSDAIDGSPTEMVCSAHRRNQVAQPQEVGRVLNRWLAGNPPTSPQVAPNPVGEGEVSIASFRLGLQHEIGVLVAGSHRADFPTEIEMLLLPVAANQAATGLQEARRLNERRRTSERLEQQVVERTSQLTAVDEELRKEITERKLTEEALQKLQAELAHATRVMSLGELTASIAHEINQPLAAVVTNGNACLRWLGREVPDLEEARAAVERMVRDGHRASEVIRRIRALSQNTAPQKAWLDLNDVIHEVLALVHSEVHQHGVALLSELAATLPPVLGDRTQVQQVLLNLLMNGIEAMQPIADRPRELRIRSQPHAADTVLVAVEDTGVGLDPLQLGRLFDAFFTTKPDGVGLGLSISRRIIEARAGKLWATPNDRHGMTMLFTLPTGEGG